MVSYIVSELNTSEKRLVQLLRTHYDSFGTVVLVILKTLCFVSHMKMWVAGTSLIADDLMYLVQCTLLNPVLDPYLYASTMILQLHTSMIVSKRLIAISSKSLVFK
jgi:hypothetical protein